MTEQIRMPSASQIEAARKADRAITAELQLLAGEGMELSSIMAGLSSAAAAIIGTHAGADKIAPWFAAQARLVEDLKGEGIDFG